ncbi:MAG: imidazole glycerol phosphate synthase subunit HisH [Gemmatimonadetes bacterium]|nr:imidazole glycerol phosphate synthase subunit HisH [Gemmatimonadota bacterium]MCC6769625.1 imidazole glycerol phosphate synthase subunit HisH [Gemmatimonadaceae bacterium]
MPEPRITIFDYGAGNLHSLAKAVASFGTAPVVETDPVRAVETDVLLLPGVGAFTPAAERLAPGRDVMQQALAGGLPCLGICLGMQLLLDGSDEGTGSGLGVIPGWVTRIDAERLPQIGWNSLEDAIDPLLAESGLDTVYYANSFICRPDKRSHVTSWSTHGGDRFAGSVRRGRTVGVQFHPEKSSSAGVAFIHAFLREMLT